MSVDMNRKYTSDEFLALSDLDGRYELVSGDIYAMTPALSYQHQRISMGLSWKIKSYINDNKGDCEVLAAPSDVKLNDENTVQPDVFVVCDKNKFNEHGCIGAPDWVIEIASQSDARRDYVDKLALYSESGVKEYWIVDPESEKVLVYPFAESKATGIYTFDDNITAGIYRDHDPQLSICIRELL